MRGWWLALLLIPSTIGLELVQPYLIKVAIDRYIATGQLAGLNRLALIYLAVLIVVLCAVWGILAPSFLTLQNAVDLIDLDAGAAALRTGSAPHDLARLQHSQQFHLKVG